MEKDQKGESVVKSRVDRDLRGKGQWSPIRIGGNLAASKERDNKTIPPTNLNPMFMFERHIRNQIKRLYTLKDVLQTLFIIIIRLPHIRSVFLLLFKFAGISSDENDIGRFEES